MVLLPNYDNPPRLCTDMQLKYIPRFSVWYDGAVLTFTGTTTAPVSGYTLTDLLSNQYNEYVKWNAATVRITATFPQREVDTLILAGVDANKIKGNINLGSELQIGLGRHFWSVRRKDRIKTHTGGRIYFITNPEETADLGRVLPPMFPELPVNDQGIVVIKFHKTQADNIDIQLLGNAGQELHKIYLGSEKTFSLCSSISALFRTNGVQNISDIGVVYGHKMNAYRIINASWKLIDDVDRHEMERYIKSVQVVEPHYIMPVSEDYYIPPMFCVLTKQELSNNKKDDNWMWAGNSLEWVEAK